MKKEIRSEIKEMNLIETVGNYGNTDLIFEIEGKKYIIKDVLTPADADEYYFEDDELLQEIAENYEIEELEK